jgi:hypothetical protein
VESFGFTPYWLRGFVKQFAPVALLSLCGVQVTRHVDTGHGIRDTEDTEIQVSDTGTAIPGNRTQSTRYIYIKL